MYQNLAIAQISCASSRGLCIGNLKRPRTLHDEATRAQLALSQEQGEYRGYIGLYIGIMVDRVILG